MSPGVQSANTNLPEQTRERLLRVHLQESSDLKREQLERIKVRDNQVYINLVTSGAVAAFVLNGPQHDIALLAIPWINFVVGWLYIVNDQKISAIGKYLRKELGLVIIDLLQVPEDVLDKFYWGNPVDCTHPVLFGWEFLHRTDKGRRVRKTVQLATDLLMFGVPGVAALTWFLSRRFSTPAFRLTLSPLELLAVFIEVVLLTVLTVGLVKGADLGLGTK